MNEILNKVHVDLNKLQKTLEREGEVLISKIKDAANKAASNKNVVAGKKEFEKLVDTQIKKLEPAFNKLYKELKVTAGKYGVNLDKLQQDIKTTTEKAATRLHLKSKTAGKAKTKTSAEKPAGTSAGKKSPSSGARKKANKKV